MVDVRETTDPEPDRPISAGAGHVKKMISFFSNGFVINGEESSLCNEEGRSRVVQSKLCNDDTGERLSPTKSSMDEVDDCIRPNYVVSRILNFEGITDVDASQLKKLPVRQAAYRKFNGSARSQEKKLPIEAKSSNGIVNHVVADGTEREEKDVGSLAKCEDVILENGSGESGEPCEVNGSVKICDNTSVSNGAITLYTDSSQSVVAQSHTSQNGSASESHHFQNTELFAVTEDKTATPGPVSAENSSSHIEDSSKKDGSYYLSIVNQQEQLLQASVSKLQTILETDPDIPEEASGLIRATVGKSNLLIRKKFTHYRDCCMKNLNPDPTEVRRTTDADLAGLWDIVCLQISDINAMYDQIETLRRNGWKSPTTEKKEPLGSHPVKTQPTKTPRRAKASGVKNYSKDDKASKAKEEARAKAREEAKKRLLAAKKAGRQRKASQSDDVEIYVPG